MQKLNCAGRSRITPRFFRRMWLVHETLEDRRLLAAQSVAAGLELLGQPIAVSEQLDPADGLLVRFRDDAFCATAGDGCEPLRVSGELPGQWIAKGLSAVDGLREVKLRSDLDLEQSLSAFRNHPSVLYAEPNYRVRATQLPNDPRFSEMWGLENLGQTNGTLDADIDAPEAWDVSTGGGTLVAVIDTGVDYNHEDLAANMWVNPGEVPGDGIDNDGNGFVDDIHGYDFANDDGDPMDDQGHGTHVAGTIGAVGNNGIGVVGINWNAQIMAVKFLDANGSGTNADAVRAINYATQMGAQVSNSSWGGNDPFSQALYDAVNSARLAGQVFVAGAGNGNFLGLGQNNDQNPFYPASLDLDNVISVAATDRNENRAIFSNFGATSVDLAAPGVDILSTRPNNVYQRLSGTSMASPHVAGVAALILDQNPDWTYSQVISQIYSTVDPVASMDSITVTGGRLNAAAALGNPVPPPPPPPSGTLPILEDFEDGAAEFFQVRAGGWSVVDGRYRALPNGDAIATVRISDPLPSDLSLRATFNGTPPSGTLYSNSFVIFDYQNENDFKFAGAKFGSDEWLIGHRNGTSWTVDALIVQPIDEWVDYNVEVAIQNGSQVTLFVDGIEKTSYTFSSSLIDGSVGIGTWNAEARFDNFVAEPYTPPPPPIAGSLPIDENFDDLSADFFQVESGSWSAATGRYRATPNGDAISLLQIADPLPSDLELRATLSGDAATAGFYGNAFVIFDYQSPTDFKFAGLYVSSGKWAIGHRSNVTWVRDVEVFEPISAATDYDVQLLIENGQDVTLVADGSVKATYSFGSSVTGGQVGVGTWNAFADFDNVSVAEYSAPPVLTGTLPVAENFDDGVADLFDVQTGTWTVSGGQYQANGRGNAISSIRIGDPLPSDFELRATINADPGGGGLYSNAFVIFDYQSETDFKFAGALVGSNKWVVGHRIGTSWTIDAELVGSISTGVDYAVQAVIENGAKVSLFVGGTLMVTYSFTGPLDDGLVGLATWNADSRFDDVVVQAYLPPPPPPSATLPLSEDFEDGVADFFDTPTGSWSVASGRYLATAASDAIAIARIDQTLPANLEIGATVNAEPAVGNLYSNAYLVFDYQSPTDFKFAGASLGGGKWAIGHRSGSSWITDASATGAISANTDYDIQVQIENDDVVTLLVNGLPRVSHRFGTSLINGDVGLATWKANSQFDDVTISSFTPPPPPPAATLPMLEDFEDGVADFFDQKTGVWDVAGGRYQATPGGDAITTIRTAQTLPGDLDLQATVNASPVSGGFYSNGYVVFDYQSPTDFKFAGASLGSGKWVIGHRSGSTWITDASFGETIAASTDYLLRAVVRSDSQVTLYVDGAPKVSYSFGGPLSDGQVGLATWNAFSQFDDVSVQPFVTGVSMTEAAPDALASVAAAIVRRAGSSSTQRTSLGRERESDTAATEATAGDAREFVRRSVLSPDSVDQLFGGELPRGQLSTGQYETLDEELMQGLSLH